MTKIIIIFKKISEYISKSLIKIIIFLINLLRPLLGTKYCCIYPISCSNYAKDLLQQKPLYVSIPLIILRLLKCNPLTALFWKIKNLSHK